MQDDFSLQQDHMIMQRTSPFELISRQLALLQQQGLRIYHNSLRLFFKQREKWCRNLEMYLLSIAANYPSGSCSYPSCSRIITLNESGGCRLLGSAKLPYNNTLPKTFGILYTMPQRKSIDPHTMASLSD